MIVTENNTRLYLSSWEYNGALILSRLAEIVKSKGGKVKPCCTAVISNRTIDEKIDKLNERRARLVQVLTAGNGNDLQRHALKEVTEELEEMRRFNNAPVTVTHTSYITFVLDNVLYYYQIDDNPFFPFRYSKTPLRGDSYSKDAAGMDAGKEWFEDCYLFSGCTPEQIERAARSILDALLKVKFSPIMRDSTRRRVQNTYNSGYHYETIYRPERVGKVEW